jgi:NADH-quinone oxidoreductase subunit K
MLSIDHYLALSAALFAVGVAGVLARRNLIMMLLSIELMLNAVNINLAAFSRLHGTTDGQSFALFVMVAAAAEAAVGLGIVFAFLRNRASVSIDEMDQLKW